MNNWIIGFVILQVVVSCTGEKPQYDWLDKQLVEVHELQEAMKSDDRIKLIDLRKKEKYLTGHLPNALQVWRNMMVDSVSYHYGGMMASRQHMQSLMSYLGVNSNDILVIYDASGQVNAARLWWILDYYGFRNVALLNGGIQAWKQAKLPLENHEIKADAPGIFEFPKQANTSRYADIQSIQKRPDAAVLVDCRSEDEYSGQQMKKGAYRAGHIPNAVNIDFMECINRGGENDCTFKNADSLNAIYAQYRISPSDSIIIYCHSGVRSAHSTFVLSKLLNYKNVRNYDGSWIEWSYNKELKISSDSTFILN